MAELWNIPQNHPTYSLPQLRSWQLDLAKHLGVPLILFFHTLHPACQEILLILPSIRTQDQTTSQHGRCFLWSKPPSPHASITARASHLVSLLPSLPLQSIVLLAGRTTLTM